MLVILLIIFILFTSPVFADPIIKITDFSSDSDPEWIQLTNTTNETQTLNGWYFKDNASHIREIETVCFSPSSNKTFSYSSGWLNNDGDTINLYNPNGVLIDQLIYSDPESKNQTPPESTNTCLIPTNTPTPTFTPSPTPTIDPAIINPSSGISLTEFMPYADPEWIEIYNSNDKPIKLVSWKVEDNNGNTKNIDNLSIPSKSYGVYELKGLLFDNNDGDTILLRDQNNNNIGSPFSYSKGLMTIEKSWSLINGNWCQSTITKGSENINSCYTIATPTPPISFTPTPTSEEIPSIEPTPNITDTPTITQESNNSDISSSSGLVLGESDNSTKQNFLPIILIFGGAILLLSPVIISKLKKS